MAQKYIFTTKSLTQHIILIFLGYRIQPERRKIGVTFSQIVLEVSIQ